MENFHLGDFNLNFEFDFQHDFTDGENRVIDDLLANPVDTTGLFEAEPPFDGNQTNSSSFFDYLYNGSATTIDINSLENLSKNQMVQFNGDQVSREVDSYPIQPDGMVAEQNLNFDWTTFLDESSNQGNVIVETPSSVPEESMQYDTVVDSDNVIRDNGFVYQELKTLDVPQMYTNLDESFGLMDLKTIDENMDYSVLANDTQSDQNDQNVVNSNAPSMKQKLFFLPMQLNQKGTESLLQVATKVKNNPLLLNSMINKCTDRETNIKILLPSPPKQIKTKSERYLTVNEQLEQIQTKEIILPSVERKQRQKKRKQAPKLDQEKVSVAYAVEVVLTNIMEPSTSADSNVNSPANKKKATRAKKVTAKVAASKRRANDDEFLPEPKSTRRSCKRIKTE